MWKAALSPSPSWIQSERAIQVWLLSIHLWESGLQTYLPVYTHVDVSSSSSLCTNSPDSIVHESPKPQDQPLNKLDVPQEQSLKSSTHQQGSSRRSSAHLRYKVCLLVTPPTSPESPGPEPIVGDVESIASSTESIVSIWRAPQTKNLYIQQCHICLVMFFLLCFFVLFFLLCFFVLFFLLCFFCYVFFCSVFFCYVFFVFPFLFLLPWLICYVMFDKWFIQWKIHEINIMPLNEDAFT